jgi:uncharacterized protein YqjF (DUF2071 family)
MLNYAVEPSMLRPLVPSGTELDSWQGITFVSLVGFLFANTRILGLPIPRHRTFEEVNLRFYVRRRVEGEERRAVTFIRELVPRSMIARVARLVYNEPYLALPMRHRFGAPSMDGVPEAVEYGWQLSSGWAGVSVQSTGAGRSAEVGSQEEFITEHYWGYTKQRDGSTVEYRVAHPAWRVWSVRNPRVTGDMSQLYGEEFARVLNAPPASAFLADGSAVTVYAPSHLIR